MDLPRCQFRAPAEPLGLFRCASPVLRITEAVPAVVCQTCPAPDQASGRVAPALRPPCLYRGAVYRPATTALPEVYSCGKHGECTLTVASANRPICETCSDHRPRDMTPAAADAPENSVEVMTAILRGPRRDWPSDWPFWGTTLEAHRRLAAEYAAGIHSYPEGKYQGRGIVILGGGAFFPGVYVTIRMIRHFGCDLPIEVWHHARTEPLEEAWLRPYGVHCIDIDRHMDRVTSSRLRGGWVSKFYAVMYSSFEEVLYLDSDCYPVANVADFFERNPHGAVFWPNLKHTNNFMHWSVYGTEPSDRPPIQGGQFLLHKQHCWPELLLAQWWNEHADFCYRHGYGDEDILRGVWQARAKPFTMYQDRPEWDRVAYVFAGPDGHRPALIHRCHDKFRLPLLELRCHDPIAASLYHHWSSTPETMYQRGMPGEDLAFAFFNEFKQRYFDHDPGRFRPGTDDAFAWETIVHQNVYRLPERLPEGSRVLDIGGQIGAFAHLACRRGAAHVRTLESEEESFRQLSRNLAYWGRRITAECRMPATGAELDQILVETSGGADSIDLLKLTCGDSEWPLLSSAQHLSRCRQIVGEYQSRQREGRRYGPADLCAMLGRHGFTVRTEPHSDSHGLFWARKE